ncbi:MAG: penicillin-binding protein 2 [Proteobacteria bacterium]|nr:penicillin-binding protein 2 [Pseudomonadota bacterium]
MHDLRHRIRIASTLALAGFAVLGARLVGLADAHADVALDNALREQRVLPPRGRILDREGRLLADARPSVDLTLVAAEVIDPDAVVETLVPYLDERAIEQLGESLDAKGYARHASRIIARDLDEDVQARIAARLHKLPGVALAAGHQRTYPEGVAAPHLVGTVGEVNANDLLRRDRSRYRAGDQVGRRGVESALERELRGETGNAVTLVDALGRPVEASQAWGERLTAEQTARRALARPGADVRLTLDLDLQSVATEALGDRPGSAVLIDVRTGELLAYASAPGFDPDELVHGVDRARWSALRADEDRPLLDRASRGLYPPASTFKLVSGSAAVDAGVDPATTVNCTGGTRIGRRTFHCWKRSGHGIVDLEGALKNSCDIWFYATGQQLGPDGLGTAARDLGLGTATGFDLGDERTGLVPDEAWHVDRHDRPWGDGDSASASIGQGMNLVTPIQLAVMTAAVATGERPTPWVVAEVSDPDGRVRKLGAPTEPIAVQTSDLALGAVRSGMRAVMQDGGTGSRLQIEGFEYAGKTGTAQVVSARTKAAHPGRHTEDHALFVGYAPATNPEVAVAVVLEHAGGGSTHAGPVARDLIEAWAVKSGALTLSEEAP